MEAIYRSSPRKFDGAIEPHNSPDQALFFDCKWQQWRTCAAMTDDAGAAERNEYDEDEEDQTPTADDAVLGVDSTTSDESSSASEQVYVNSGNQKKVLYILCCGLLLSDTHKDTPLFSLDTEPWSLMPKTDVPRPMNADFAKEVVRRAEILCMHPTPRPLNWPKTQKIEWLEANPIQDNTDILFLRDEVSRVKHIMEQSLAMEQQQRELLGLSSVSRGGNWRGNVPYPRIIMILTQDNIKVAFLRRADAQSRQELDARNSENRLSPLLSLSLLLLTCTNSTSACLFALTGS
jgi:hypothetical protein